MPQSLWKTKTIPPHSPQKKVCCQCSTKAYHNIFAVLVYSLGTANDPKASFISWFNIPVMLKITPN